MSSTNFSVPKAADESIRLLVATPDGDAPGLLEIRYREEEGVISVYLDEQLLFDCDWEEGLRETMIRALYLWETLPER